MNTQIIEHVSYLYFVRGEILKTSAQIMRSRTASTDTLYRKWASPSILHVIANLGKWLKNLPNAVGDAWKGVRGNLQRFAELFKNPQIIKSLTQFVGDVTPKNLLRFLEGGKKVASSLFKGIKALLIRPSDMPTLTDLIKKTTIGAGIFEWFEKNVNPKANVVDEWLKKHIPKLRKPLIAAVFAFIWFNVDELSWDWSSLIQGFTGNISLAELIISLPESIIGLITGNLFGIGFTVMPYMLAGRILWLAGKKYLVWNGKEWRPTKA